MTIPPADTLQLMIAKAEAQGFTHSAAALRDIYARHYSQPRRQAMKDSHSPWETPHADSGKHPVGNGPANG